MDTETFGLLKDQLARYVEERLIPAEDAVEEADDIPPDIVSEFKAMGLFGLSVPEEFGGLGLTMAEESQLVRILTRASVTFRSLIGTTVGIGSQGIMIDGTEAQKAEWLPKFATGEAIASFALTEPGAGSDAASLRCSAVQEGEYFRINGTKRYITNAPQAGLFTVFARSDPGRKGASGVSAFLVEAGTPGLRLGRPDRKMGQRGAQTCDIILDGCRVPGDALLGGRECEGFRTAMKVLDRGRLHISAVCVGVATRLLDDALRFAMERRQFGQPIAEFQLVQAMLADSRAEVLASRAMVLETARRKDEGADVGIDASCCKLFCSEMVGRVADRAVQVHGGAGYMQDYAVERLYRDVRLFRIYEGTSEIQRLVIARGMIRDAKG